MRVCVIFNPTARGDKAKHFRERLAVLSSRVTLKPTYAPGSARILAATAVRENFETVIAAGGDGTLNEVLNGIGDVEGGFSRTRLGVLPLGTINVFARELALPMQLDAAWGIIEQGREIAIDLPSAEFSQDGVVCRRYFAQLAGAGLDSRAIELVNWKQKKLLGPMAYVVAGLKAMTERKTPITFSTANVEVQGELIIVGNGRFYGGNFELFPKADLMDGLLNVTIFPKVNWEIMLRTGWGWLTDQLHCKGGCQQFTTESFRLSSSMSAFQMDGENVGDLPASFSIQGRALRVIVA
jgi:diacylglycerol kinase (ATP)